MFVVQASRLQKQPRRLHRNERRIVLLQHCRQQAMHATAYLKEYSQQHPSSIVVLPGPERSLKQAVLETVCRQALGTSEDEASISRFAGAEADLKTVRDELFTVSMWGECRIVVLEEADTFVSQNRAALEAYVEKPAKKSILILDVKSWPKNTRLAKSLAKKGLVVECTPLTGGELQRWIASVCLELHGKEITRDAIALLIELAGNSLGLLDQELAKLSSYAEGAPRIDVSDVRKLVGGWRAETTWAMINALRDGKLDAALMHLNKLLVSGEAPQRILGGINFVFRKLACATELARQGQGLNAALSQAGVFGAEISRSNAYLRRIGRERAERLLASLLQADNNLKGGSRLPSSVQLEQLLVRLSGKT